MGWRISLRWLAGEPNVIGLVIDFCAPHKFLWTWRWFLGHGHFCQLESTPGQNLVGVGNWQFCSTDKCLWVERQFLYCLEWPTSKIGEHKMAYQRWTFLETSSANFLHFRYLKYNPHITWKNTQKWENPHNTLYHHLSVQNTKHGMIPDKYHQINLSVFIVCCVLLSQLSEPCDPVKG